MCRYSSTPASARFSSGLPAAAILADLREAAKLARKLGIAFTSRAEPRLLNAFPSLCESAEDVGKLPFDLPSLLARAGRKDMIT